MKRVFWCMDALLPKGSNWEWKQIIGPCNSQDELFDEFFKDKNYRNYERFKIRCRKMKGVHKLWVTTE